MTDTREIQMPTLTIKDLPVHENLENIEAKRIFGGSLSTSTKRDDRREDETPRDNQQDDESLGLIFWDIDIAT